MGALLDFFKRPLFQIRGEGTVVTSPEADVRDSPHTTQEIIEPQSFDEYIGQREAKAILQVEIESARRQGRPPAHTLLYGPPGVGKTVLAHIIAKETGCLLYPATGAEYSGQREVLLAFARIGNWHRSSGQPVAWLIDEIDAMSRVVTYILHTLMTHGYIYYQGERFGLVPVSIVGTTNHMASVHSALKDRFQVVAKLDYYSPEELGKIAAQTAHKMGIRMTDEAAMFIGLNGGGEPRKVTRRILPALANLVYGGAVADVAAVERALALSALRPGGLTKSQVDYLKFLESSKEQTAGLSSLAAYLSEPRADIESEVEPFLIRSRAVTIVTRGRQLTDTGKEFLKNIDAYAAL